VLVDGGHSHVEVLRALMRWPVPGVDLSVVTESAGAVYSRMVQGLVAGQEDSLIISGGRLTGGPPAPDVICHPRTRNAAGADATAAR